MEADSLSMESSFLQKSVFGLKKALANPRAAVAWVIRGSLARDPVFISQTYWFTGTLPRVALNGVLDGVRDLDIALPRAFDRHSGRTAAITAEEACHVAAIARSRAGGRALEIGTSDGNTSLLLAANLGEGGRVVTVDLPPAFSIDDQQSLAHADGEFNLTPREKLGRQYQAHPLATRITQVYGDSGSLDWSQFGGPFDVIFIDGSHTESYVRSDSKNALRQLAAGGIVVWHDYGMIPAVSLVVDEFAREHPSLRIHAIEGTRLAVALS
jgi:predicted O-methyltransferase YrrM